MSKKVFLVLMLFLSLFMLSCADSVNVDECLPKTEEPSGFWSGTWDGFIMAFSFIGSLFSDNIAVYAVNNNGAWYDFGFVGGFFILLKIIGNIIKVLFR
jgi:hypothetical protein